MKSFRRASSDGERIPRDEGGHEGKNDRIMALVLVIRIGFLVPKAAAQSDKYSKMAPVDQYLMKRNAEILLARSAAPDSISSDATILVLGRQGYETAVRGKDGFVWKIRIGVGPAICAIFLEG